MATATDSTLKAYKQQALEDSANANAALTSKAKDLHARYVDPNLRVVAAHAQHAPLAATLIGVFGAFALVPVTIFLLFAVGVLVIVGGGAFLLAAVAIAWLIGSAGESAEPPSVLVRHLINPVATTGGLVAAFLAYRFAALLSQSDTLPDAVRTFQSEASNLLVPGAAARKAGVRPGMQRAPSSKVHFDAVVKEEGVGEVPVKED
ncbi:hypothetical protein JCM8202v2_002519 [Rhodotorula sphaerocarpa]